MGGMSKRKYGSPGSKSIVNEEEEGESVHVVMGEKRNMDETVRQENNKDTKDSTGCDNGGYTLYSTHGKF